MTIERRKGKKGWHYRARVIQDGYPYRGSWQSAKWRAQKDEADLLEARAHGTLEQEYGPNRIPTFEEAAAEYLEHCEKRVERGDEARRTVDAKRTHLDQQLLKRFGEQRIDEITTDQVEVFKRALYRDLAGGTVNRYLATLSGVFRHFRRRVRNPVRGIERYPENKDAWKAPTRELVEQIIRACKGSGNDHLATVVLLLFELAARVGEIRPLRWEQIDFDWCDRRGVKRGIITWERTKSGERQTVPMTVRAREELLRHRKRFDSEWCFPSPVKDAPISYDSLRGAWVVVLKGMEGVPHLRFHDLRHGRATQLIGMDIATEKVQRVGRWKSRQSMDRYIHMRAEQAADAFAVAEALPDEAGVEDLDQRRSS